MKYNLWRSIKSVETEYLKSLNVLCDMFSKIAKASNGNGDLYINKMLEFQNSVQYQKYIYSIVKRMIYPLSVNNKKIWKKAVNGKSMNKLFYRALMREIDEELKKSLDEQIEENANLIKTLPSDVALKVTKDIEEKALAGLRSSEIAKIISAQTYKHSRASARLIARTEVSKTSTALTKARSEKLNIRWYVWRTALDGNRVRKSHQIMEGVLVSWNNPPSPEMLAGEKSVGNYHAGEIWNCRCYAEPLLNIDDVKWPHKVYLNNQLVNMGKREFEELI